MITLPQHVCVCVCVCVCACVYMYIFFVRYTFYIKHSRQRYAAGEVTMSLVGQEDLGEWKGGNEEM